jgi:hypothetical protein
MTEYWGQPRDCDSDGHRLQRWKVRSQTHSLGTCIYSRRWLVYTPDGELSKDCRTWAGALEWATRITPHIEQWLQHQNEESA